MSRHFTIDGGGGGGAVVFGGARGVPTAPSGTEERTDGRTDRVGECASERTTKTEIIGQTSILPWLSVRPSVRQFSPVPKPIPFYGERERERERDGEEGRATE